MDSSPKEIQWLLQEKYNGEKSEAFYADCKRLALGEPLAYIIGFSPFIDCKIWLDSHPLIPRPETEFWTQQCIDTIQRGATLPLGVSEKSIRVLDVCAGSGCIGIAIAKAIPSARVEFSEIDARHIKTIHKNLTENDISSDRTLVHHADLFTGITGQFDYIVSNPPYIDEHNSQADISVVDHEPHLALFGGREGMETIRNIISQAADYLAPNGQLWIEHEPEQLVKIAIVSEKNGLGSTTYKDQYTVDRYTVIQ